MMEASSSGGNSRQPSPVPVTQDSLEDLEMTLLGVSTAGESLPPPPIDVIAQGLAKKAAGNATPPLGRAKRPKNAESLPGSAAVTRAVASLNNDFCSACGGRGQFLCCDGGCLRSFHFNCLDPPLGHEELPDENWFCKSCRAEQDPPHKSSRGLFRDLIHKVECENPRAFALPAEIKSFFKEVSTGPIGDFIDTKEHRLASKVTGKSVGQEDRDGYRFKDKTGKTMLCYQCNEAASLAKHRRIISCDFCDQHWHLDCLDPPMTGMPPPTRKWMCPVHSDNALPRVRQPKATTTIPVQDRGFMNNGDIVIIARREVERILDDYDEVTVNRVRYQIPEDTVILDFFGRVSGESRMAMLRKPIKRHLFDQLDLSRPNGHHRAMSGSLSPLTSLDESDDDMNGSQANGEPSTSRPPTSALDDLALLANGYHASLVYDREHAHPPVVAPPLSAAAAASPSTIRPSGPPASSSASMAVTNGRITITLPARSTNGSVDKGKGRAVEVADADAQPITSATSSAGSAAMGGAISTMERLRNAYKPTTTSTATAAAANASTSTLSSSGIAKIPPFNGGRASPSPSASSGSGAKKMKMTTNKGGRDTEAELRVESKDDLKALMHVRKLMMSSSGSAGGAMGEDQRAVMVEFLEGKAIVPKLDFISGAAKGAGTTTTSNESAAVKTSSDPWQLPWNDPAPQPQPLPLPIATPLAVDMAVDPTPIVVAASIAIPSVAPIPIFASTAAPIAREARQ